MFVVAMYNVVGPTMVVSVPKMYAFVFLVIIP